MEFYSNVCASCTPAVVAAAQLAGSKVCIVVLLVLVVHTHRFFLFFTVFSPVQVAGQGLFCIFCVCIMYCGGRMNG